MPVHITDLEFLKTSAKLHICLLYCRGGACPVLASSTSNPSALHSPYTESPTHLYPVPLQQLASDHQALDLAGSLANKHERRVPVIAFHVEFFGVAKTAINAHRF